MENEEKKILYSSYNQEGSCFCIGTNKGYTIYCKNQLKGYSDRILGFGVSLISMLDKTNILGLIKTTAKTKLIIYDDNDSKIVTEIEAKF